jgi:hypothetical protein
MTVWTWFVFVVSSVASIHMGYTMARCVLASAARPAKPSEN